MDARHGEIFQKYLAGGLSLVPCGQDKRPTVKWKEYQKRTPTPAELNRWLQTDAEAFAAVCGQVSGGLEIIDFDDNAGALPMAYSALDFYDAWRDEVGALVDHHKMVVQRTGGGGFQVAYRCAHPAPNQKLAWVQDEAQEHGRSIAIETRGEGGYAVVAPSLHPSGNYYRMIAGDFAAVPVIPQEIRDRLIEAARALDLMPYTTQEVVQVKSEARPTRYPDQVSIIDTYNDQHRIADVLSAHGYTRGRNGRYSRPGKGDSLGVAVIERENISFHWSSNDPLNKINAAGKPVPIDPFNVFTLFEHRGDVREAVKDAARILRIDNTRRVYTNGHHAEPDAPAAAKESEPLKEGESFDQFFLRQSADDEGNAQCVHKVVGGDYLYCDAYGWMHNVGTNWTYGGIAEKHINLAVTHTLIDRRLLAVKKGNENIVKATRSSATNKENVKRQFKDLVWVDVNNFDDEKHLLNCKNGVVDLRTGQLITHQPSDRFTYCVNSEFEPGVDLAIWTSFLGNTVKDYANVDAWLQMAAGYSISGFTNEEVMFYVFGPGRSGKGTFTNAFLATLGEPLATGVSFSMFTARRDGDSQNFDLARLKPCRFVSASESGKNQALNEAVVKQITGNDPITASFKGKDHFTYFPQFKVWLSSNHQVKGDVDDDAFWSRVRVLEFPNSHIGDEDKSLKERMRSDECRRALLAWAIRGASMWYHDAKGLITPTSIADSTATQRAALDTVGRWLEACTVTKPDAQTVNAELYSSYSKWCGENGESPKFGPSFGRAMVKKGFEQTSIRRPGRSPERGYKGIGLVADL
jgi:P4 family phage/plasmid primase-like protien